jgi:hypothetical protein
MQIHSVGIDLSKITFHLVAWHSAPPARRLRGKKFTRKQLLAYSANMQKQKQEPRRRLWLSDGSCVRLRPQHANHVWSYDVVSAEDT